MNNTQYFYGTYNILNVIKLMIVQSGPHVETIITLEQHKANDIKLALWLSSNVIIVSNDITLTMTIQGHNCLVLISTEPFRWVSGGGLW